MTDHPDERLDLREDAIDSYNTFVTLKLEAGAGTRRAIKLPGLPPLYKALAETLHALAGFHPSDLRGEFGPREYQAATQDLEAIARIVGTLFDAYAAETGVKELKGCLDAALEEPLYLLDKAARDKRLKLAEHREHGSRMPMERV